MLVAELQRTKNLFAVIQALAHSSLRGNKILEEARQAFNRRLIVLARAHDRLLNASWKGISLSDLVHLELEEFPVARERRWARGCPCMNTQRIRELRGVSKSEELSLSKCGPVHHKADSADRSVRCANVPAIRDAAAR